MSSKTKAIIKEWVQSIVIALILALTVRTFIVQAYKIPTGSMKPTLMPGDRILVNKLVYRLHPPERGDIVVFESTIEPRKDFIKRLVGKGNEDLDIVNGNIEINSEIITSPDIFSRIYYYRKGDFISGKDKVHIPPNYYFMLGDNSLHSNDSRFWGVIPEKNIKGKAFFIYWPISRIRVLNAKEND